VDTYGSKSGENVPFCVQSDQVCANVDKQSWQKLIVWLTAVGNVPGAGLAA
jgi:hypothetical protein